MRKSQRPPVSIKERWKGFRQTMFTAYFDSGTTNTRLYLLDERFHIICQEKAGIGSKDAAICGSSRTLITSMKELYDRALESCGLRDEDVEALYASGMVTSPYGLKEVPHQQIPVSIETFAGSLYPYFEDEAFHRTIYLVPGLKTPGEDMTFVNNMRGEEIEVIGALDDLPQPPGGVAVILPGSHTHVAYIKEKQIKGLLSNFTGELFHALKTATILAPVLSAEEELDEPAVKRGYQCLEEFGFNRAIYMAHAMRIFEKGTLQERFSFGEGVINGGMRQSIEYYCENFWEGCRTVALLGNEFMYKLYSYIFEDSKRIKEVLWLPDSESMPYSVKGLARIAGIRDEQKKNCMKD